MCVRGWGGIGREWGSILLLARAVDSEAVGEIIAESALGDQCWYKKLFAMGFSAVSDVCA